MSSLIPQPTADGSMTFFSKPFGEAFHSLHGAKQEADCKFVQPTQLAQQAQRSQLHLLDICYGLGYNTAAALETIWAANPACRVHLTALELDVTVPQAAIAANLLVSWSKPVQMALIPLAADQRVETTRLNARLLLGDARQTIQSVAAGEMDAIFLDPFSPPRCPQLWTIEFLALVARCLKHTGRLATYSCAASVRSALVAADVRIGSTPPVGRRAPGTVASFEAIDLPPLSQQEDEHLRTRAAIPYRDPTLSDSAIKILERRQMEQQCSVNEPTSHWKKRWFSSATEAGSP
ncbi:hypothetical protein H6F43_21010 [Leptolyngbya sp. FACHB-36]|uniref:tRNA (5-methylaminomethyl-2-thiouridine)(34)-methyltransferase MnmD n=1 Tax=Leptolyngbya sp. FACHB-36 TaxID=2692808 RepID=UPI001681A14B|nr:MnmC family methyltransferase [Leptolyngbya sp. FACHB-36]MBD2022667.1 hypothetical protein [Leptolyngbya sp. FACHB-36]